MSTIDLDLTSSLPANRLAARPPEIIDVDLLDEHSDAPSRFGRPPHTHRNAVAGSSRLPADEPIVISDSDEEGDIQFVGSSHAQPPRPVNRSRIFSPPPPHQLEIIPPVPPLPRRFLPPMRHRPPLFPSTSSGVVLAHHEPFAFEEAMIRRRSRAEQGQAEAPPPAAAQRSHHVPAMGFGGALLALTRDALAGGRSTHPGSHQQRQNFNHAFSLGVFRRWGNFELFPPPADPFGHEDEANILFGGDEIPDYLLPAAERHALRQVEEDYMPQYTHPNKPSSGFTFDFPPSSSTIPSADRSSQSVIVVDDSPGPSSANSCISRVDEARAMLVCAACLDPLYLGTSDVGEDRNKRRLWGLRCGHLFDGKCIDKLMMPPPLLERIAQDHPKPDIKGKGKAVANSVVGFPVTPTNGDDIGSSLEALDDESHVWYSHSSTSPDTSMRSRLRPRHAPHSSGVPPAHSFPSHGRSVRPLPRRRSLGAQASSRRGAKGMGKGKGKANGPIVQAEHEWVCPVSGCGRSHLSVLIDGKWIHDESRGAIAVYV